MFNCCLGKSGVSPPSNNLLQDVHCAPSRRTKTTVPRNQLLSATSSAAISNIFADACSVKPDSALRPSGPHAIIAQGAIDYVATVSTVSAYRASDLYKSTHRDETGRLIDTTLSAQGFAFKERLKTYRDIADGRHNIQVAEQEKAGEPFSDARQNAQLAKHVLAALHEATEEHTADQMPTNCYEKALLSFEFIAKSRENPQLDVVGLARGLPCTAPDARTGENVFLPRGPDHTVLVIGRSPQSDVTDPESWGPSVIICDASNNEFYFASDLKEHFSDTVTGSTGRTLMFESVISLPENTHYDPNPSVIHDFPKNQLASVNSTWVAFGQADTDAGMDDHSVDEQLFF